MIRTGRIAFTNLQKGQMNGILILRKCAFRSNERKSEFTVRHEAYQKKTNMIIEANRSKKSVVQLLSPFDSHL